jgi:predicted nuclease of predicted toxin-antitoxin system
MKFKIDENLPIDATKLFRNAGHDAWSVYDQSLSGKSDDEIALVCQQEQRILVTLDVDFADIRAYPPGLYPGIIVLCIRRHDKVLILDVLRRLLETVSPEPINGRLWIIEENRIRIRE